PDAALRFLNQPPDQQSEHRERAENSKVGGLLTRASSHSFSASSFSAPARAEASDRLAYAWPSTTYNSVRKRMTPEVSAPGRAPPSFSHACLAILRASGCDMTFSS